MHAAVTTLRAPLTRDATLALAALAAVVFLAASFAVTRPPWSVGVQISDVPDYARYGEAIAAGGVPYRDVALEYPPGALAAFVPPALVTSGEDEYARAFAWLMRLCGVALVGAVAISLRAIGARRGEAALALALVALAPVLLGRIVLQRFDLLPAALLALALAALLARRDRTAFLLIALGAGTKLYPALAVPVFLAAVAHRRGAREAVLCAAVFGGVVLAMLAPFAVVAPDGLADAFTRQADRPLHRESTGGAVLLVAHQVAGLDLDSVRGHGSTNFTGGPARTLATLSVLAQAAALLAIWLFAARRRITDELVVRLGAAAVLAFVVLGKVLSPQFLIWLVPLVVLVRGRRGVAAMALLAGALVLTQAYFPRRYLALEQLAAAPSWLIAARDAILLVLLVLLVLPRTAPASPASRR